MRPGRRFTRVPWLASPLAPSWIPLLALPWLALPAGPLGPLDAGRVHWLWPSLRSGAALRHAGERAAPTAGPDDDASQAEAPTPTPTPTDDPDLEPDEQDEWDLIDEMGPGPGAGPRPDLDEAGSHP